MDASRGNTSAHTTALYVKESKSSNKEYAFKMFGYFSDLSDIEIDKNNDKLIILIKNLKNQYLHVKNLLNKKESYFQRFDES